MLWTFARFNRRAGLAEALERQLITNQIGVSRDFGGAKFLRLGSHFSGGFILPQGGILFAKTEYAVGFAGRSQSSRGKFSPPCHARPSRWNSSSQ